MEHPRRVVHVVLATVVAILLVVVAGSAPAGAADQVPDRPPYQRYVALGDSYTAGPLIPQLDPAGGCFRSTNNYPALVARELSGTAFVDRSCSGADTTDLAGSQLTAFGPVPPQLDSLTADTDLVTVSVGGNDFSVFGTLVSHCTTLRAADPTGSPCRDEMRADGRDRLLADVARTQVRVTAVVRAIQQRSPAARILVVGYPQIAPRHGTCPDLLPLADGDYQYANQVNKRLTKALEHAAAVTATEYVDVYKASAGHDICSGDPWVNGQFTDPARAQNYHPFANEQRAVAGLVLAAVS